MVETALEAADELAEAGIEAEVIDPRTLVPLDIETIANSVKKTHRVVVVHEAHERVGFGAEVIAQVVTHAFDYLDAPPARVANPNVPTPFNRTLEELSIPSAAQVVRRSGRWWPRGEGRSPRSYVPGPKSGTGAAGERSVHGAADRAEALPRAKI